MFIDKREETNMLDWLTVNETATQMEVIPQDDESINGVRQVMEEAANVNWQWMLQSQSKQ